MDKDLQFKDIFNDINDIQNYQKPKIELINFDPAIDKTYNQYLKTSKVNKYFSPKNPKYER